jgi:hypothetical protein
MTENQILALDVLGYLPAGYVCIAECHNTGSKWRRVGGVYVDGVCLAMFDATKATQ